MSASTLPQTAGAHEASTRLPSLGRRGEGWVALQGLVIALVVLTGILSPRWPPGVRLWLAIAALVPLGVGLRLAIGGLRGLGSQMTALPMPVAGGRLRQGGAYALVRHPMYGGVLLFMLAWSFFLSPLALAPWLLAVSFFEAKRRREESWLMQRYAEYAEYRRRVQWRLVPFVW